MTMARLLDTHIFIALVEERFEDLPAAIRQEVESSNHDLYLSIARSSGKSPSNGGWANCR